MPQGYQYYVLSCCTSRCSHPRAFTISCDRCERINPANSSAGGDPYSGIGIGCDALRDVGRLQDWTLPNGQNLLDPMRFSLEHVLRLPPVFVHLCARRRFAPVFCVSKVSILAEQSQYIDESSTSRSMCNANILPVTETFDSNFSRKRAFLDFTTLNVSALGAFHMLQRHCSHCTHCTSPRLRFSSHADTIVRPYLLSTSHLTLVTHCTSL